MNDEDIIEVLTSGRHVIQFDTALEICSALGIPPPRQGKVTWTGRAQALKRYCFDPQRDGPGEGMYMTGLTGHLQYEVGFGQPGVDEEASIRSRFPTRQKQRLARRIRDALTHEGAWIGHPRHYLPREALEELRQRWNSYYLDEASRLCRALGLFTLETDLPSSQKIQGYINIGHPFINPIDLALYLAERLKIEDFRRLALWPRSRIRHIAGAIEKRLEEARD